MRRAVRSGHAESVSGYIARVLAEYEHRESLKKLVSDLVEEHGEPTKEDRAWARRALAWGRAVDAASAPRQASGANALRVG